METDPAAFVLIHISGAYPALCGADILASPVAFGKTVKLVPTVGPDNADDKSVTWKSSDENIAAVDSEGNVTGVGVGSATITVTITVS